MRTDTTVEALACGNYCDAGAEAEGKPPFYGIRQRQMRAWLRSQEANQLFRVPKAPKTDRVFNVLFRALYTCIQTTLPGH